MRAADWLLVWVLLMGVWPFADPGHDGVTPLSALDVALHALAGAVLVGRWLERRAVAA